LLENKSRKIAWNGHSQLHFLLQSFPLAILNHRGETIVSALWLNAKAAVLFFKNSSDF
jgi:hypothetical protein